jgi:hypothetical protein
MDMYTNSSGKHIPTNTTAAADDDDDDDVHRRLFRSRSKQEKVCIGYIYSSLLANLTTCMMVVEEDAMDCKMFL